MIASYRRGTLQLATMPVILLVLLLQYPLTIAHEAGHAFFARLFRFHPIRVLIGSGKPLFHFEALNITWIFNRIPIAGLCYATPRSLVRNQWILFGAGGLLVNAALLLLAWLALRANTPIPQNILHALLWANALVIIENVLPRTASTPFGPLATDGKLIYHALFYWNKPPPESKPPGKTQRAIFTTLQIITVLFLTLCAILILFIAGFVFYDSPASLGVRFPIAIFLLGVGIILFWYTWRLFKEPLRSDPHSSSPATIFWNKTPTTSTINSDDLAVIQTYLAGTDFQSVRDATAQLLEANPNDIRVLWMHADALLGLNEPAAAEVACDRLLVQLAAADPFDESEMHLPAVTKRLHAIMHQNDGRFENECQALLRKIISDQEKVTVLDQLACIPLVQQTPELYHSSEFCIRKALEIAPHSLTLKGTLGALLAERGQFAEAEPLLRACHQSLADNNRGITSYYFALLAEHSADLNTARKLAKQSIAIYPEPWLIQKANTLLNRTVR